LLKTQLPQQDRTAELNIRLEDPNSTKTVRRELQKSNIHDKAAFAEPLVTLLQFYVVNSAFEIECKNIFLPSILTI
jgi:hypothetical protein